MNQGVYFGQLVIGPAGSGKSTYCQQVQSMAETLRRRVIVFNFDPAAQQFAYRCDYDIRELISLDDVMEEMKLGPNGGLVYCFEYLLQNKQWLEDQLASVVPDDYILFDCPGQIQLYTHLSCFQEVIRMLQNHGFSLLSVYLMDVSFLSDPPKMDSGLLQALAALVALQLPAITVLSKCDLAKNKDDLDRFLECPDQELGPDEQPAAPANKRHGLRMAIRQVLRSSAQVSLSKLDLSDEQTIRTLILEADLAIQYGENIEPDDRMYEEAERGLSSGQQ